MIKKLQPIVVFLCLLGCQKGKVETPNDKPIDNPPSQTSFKTQMNSSPQRIDIEKLSPNSPAEIATIVQPKEFEVSHVWKDALRIEAENRQELITGDWYLVVNRMQGFPAVVEITEPKMSRVTVKVIIGNLGAIQTPATAVRFTTIQNADPGSIVSGPAFDGSKYGGILPLIFLNPVTDVSINMHGKGFLGGKTAGTSGQGGAQAGQGGKPGEAVSFNPYAGGWCGYTSGGGGGAGGPASGTTKGTLGLAGENGTKHQVNPEEGNGGKPGFPGETRTENLFVMGSGGGAGGIGGTSSQNPPNHCDAGGNGGNGGFGGNGGGAVFIIAPEFLGKIDVSAEMGSDGNLGTEASHEWGNGAGIGGKGARGGPGAAGSAMLILRTDTFSCREEAYVNLRGGKNSESNQGGRGSCVVIRD